MTGLLLALLFLVPRPSSSPLLDAVTTDPMATTPAMRQWAHAAVDATAPPSARLRQLRRALRRHGLESVAGIETPTAAEAFTARRADCVGYALLLVALAREVGVPAGYVLFERFPRPGGAPGRVGDLRVVEGHLAVGLAAETARAWDAEGALGAGGRRIPDAVALAVFHSNRGVLRLLRGDAEEARRWLRRAVALAPDWELGRHHLAIAERR